jgi:hypothetical protein
MPGKWKEKTQLNWGKWIAVVMCCALGVLAFHDRFPRQIAFVALLIIIGPVLLFVVFLSLMFVGGLIFPLYAQVFKGKKAAEYEWWRWWSLK